MPTRSLAAAARSLGPFAGHNSGPPAVVKGHEQAALTARIVDEPRSQPLEWPTSKLTVLQAWCGDAAIA